VRGRRCDELHRAMSRFIPARAGSRHRSLSSLAQEARHVASGSGNRIVERIARVADERLRQYRSLSNPPPPVSGAFWPRRAPVSTTGAVRLAVAVEVGPRDPPGGSNGVHPPRTRRRSWPYRRRAGRSVAPQQIALSVAVEIRCCVTTIGIGLNGAAAGECAVIETR
jgi:hypothetical protein